MKVTISLHLSNHFPCNYLCYNQRTLVENFQFTLSWCCPAIDKFEIDICLQRWSLKEHNAFKNSCLYSWISTTSFWCSLLWLHSTSTNLRRCAITWYTPSKQDRKVILFCNCGNILNLKSIQAKISIIYIKYPHSLQDCTLQFDGTYHVTSSLNELIPKVVPSIGVHS